MSKPKMTHDEKVSFVGNVRLFEVYKRGLSDGAARERRALRRWMSEGVFSYNEICQWLASRGKRKKITDTAQSRKSES